MLYLLEAGIDADRPGSLAGYLKTIVLGRIMRSRHLNAAARTEMIDCKIHLRGINHPYINHICPCRIYSIYKGSSQSFAVHSHITTDAQRLRIRLATLVTTKQRPQKSRSRITDFPCVFFVYLVGVNASYIICLEDCSVHLTGSCLLAFDF